MDDAAEIIAQHIIRHLESGITVDECVLQFARSTLGIESDTDLIYLITDPDLYGDGVVDLVFVPEHALSFNVEHLIPPVGLSNQSVEKIISLVNMNIVCPAIYINGIAHGVDATVFSHNCGRYVRKMRLSVEVPIADTMKKDICEINQRHIESRIIVRHGRYARSHIRDMDLKKVYLKLFHDETIDDELLHEIITFIVQLFGESNATMSLFETLCKKKQSCEMIISAMDQYKTLAERYGSEYMKFARMAPPAEDRVTTEKSLHIINLLLRLSQIESRNSRIHQLPQ